MGTLRVHRRAKEGPGARPGLRGIGEQVGEACLITPHIAQVVPPLDDLLGRIPHKAADLVVVATDGDRSRAIDVSSLQPCLIDYDEACRVAAENGAAELFLQPSELMIVLELSEPLALGARLDLDVTDVRSLGASWWCRVFCLADCKSC